MYYWPLLTAVPAKAEFCTFDITDLWIVTSYRLDIGKSTKLGTDYNWAIIILTNAVPTPARRLFAH